VTMRSYAGLLILEDVFDYVPTSNPDVVNLANMVFSPNLKVVTTDCGTTLGLFVTVNYSAEGFVELATDAPLSRDRIDQLLYNGVYSVATRSTSTCIASGGVCATCYAASFPRDATPNVNDRVIVYPEYAITTDALSGIQGQTTFTLSLSPTQYAYNYVYYNGQLYVQGTDYTISGTTLTLTVPLADNTGITVRYTSYNRAPFLIYLAEQYSGSMLGMLPLPRELLPVRSLLLTTMINSAILNVVLDLTDSNNMIPSELSNYGATIQDPLEQALYLLALQSLFANVISQ
jgi:hypothetical protein